MILTSSIIILGAGNSQLPIIKKAKTMNYTVFAIDKNPQAPGFEYADFKIIESTTNSKKIISTLKKFKNKYDFKGIVSRTTGEPLFTASEIVKEFKLTGLTYDIISTSISKSNFRFFCEKNKIFFPNGQINHSTELKNSLQFPIIIKPDLTNVGKTNIFVCYNDNELQKNFNNICEKSQNSKIEMESFIDGIDVTCACWAHNGDVIDICWWDELVGLSIDNQIVGIGASIPSVIRNTSVQTKAKQMVSKLVKQFQDVNAILLISFRISMSGVPYMIEFHLDLGGDLIAEKLLPSGNPNFDYFKTAINIATNSIIPIKDISFKPTVMCYSHKHFFPNMLQSERFTEPSIFQKGTVANNFIHLKNFLENTKFIKFKSLPKHYEWFLRHNLKNRN